MARPKALVAVGFLAAAAAPGAAGEADVVGVTVSQTGPGVYSFDVAVKHADTGWEHYANVWQVLGPDGAVLGERVLLHPHVDEQPFTRSLDGVRVPSGVAEVRIRAGDKVHGFGGAEAVIEIPR